GNACVALLCAGWLAGRGPLSSDPAVAPPHRSRGPQRLTTKLSSAAIADVRARLASVLREIGPVRGTTAAVIVVVTILGAWAEWQPWRSSDAANAAFAALDNHRTGQALAQARTAVSRDPVSVDALFNLAAI